MAKKNFATYYVGFKVLLRREGRVLVMRTRDGRLDFPGGRIDKDEYFTPIPQIIRRELREEIGGAVKYRLGRPAFQLRRYFVNKTVRIFVTVYEGEHIAGEVRLSREHTSFAWLDPKSPEFLKEKFMSHAERREITKYLKNS